MTEHACDFCDDCDNAVEEHCPDCKEWDDEPTAPQMEAMNNPDSGPVKTEYSAQYRDSMRDAGRGRLLR
jgi:hypothetical protein